MLDSIKSYSIYVERINLQLARHFLIKIIISHLRWVKELDLCIKRHSYFFEIHESIKVFQNFTIFLEALFWHEKKRYKIASNHSVLLNFSKISLFSVFAIVSLSKLKYKNENDDKDNSNHYRR